jgi:Tfp pilus assembly protein PilN
MSAMFNYARRPFRDDRPAYGLAALLLLAGAVLLTINLRLAGDYRRQVADTRAEIEQLETRERKADEKAQAARAALGSYQLSSLAEESRGLARIAAERKFSWTTLLARLERTLPTDVGLVHLQPQFDVKEGASLEMQLVARSRDAIVRTVDVLSKSPTFGRVDLRVETQPEPAAGKGDPIQFQLACAYEPDAGAAAHPRPAEHPAASKSPAAPKGPPSPKNTAPPKKSPPIPRPKARPR